MAVVPQVSPLEIVDLHQVRALLLTELFAAEEGDWQRQLHWDYRPSVEMLRKHIEARNLPGYVAFVRGRPAAYTFFIQEDQKGLIGDLYVLERYRQERPLGSEAGLATLLLERALDALEESPGLRRIETQLIGFGLEPLGEVLRRRGFESFPRLFLYRTLEAETRSPSDLPNPTPAAAPPPPWELRLWDDSYFEPMADLILAAYAGHVDSRLNDQYAQASGALRFLKNIVVFPGCGVFQREASLVAQERGTGRLVGAVLSSQVASRVAHITQICLLPSWQGRGLGRVLIETALRQLAHLGFRGVSLTVTAENHRAVELYQRLGFTGLKEFVAYARTLPPPAA